MLDLHTIEIAQQFTKNQLRTIDLLVHQYFMSKNILYDKNIIKDDKRYFTASEKLKNYYSTVQKKEYQVVPYYSRSMSHFITLCLPQIRQQYMLNLGFMPDNSVVTIYEGQKMVSMCTHVSPSIATLCALLKLVPIETFEQDFHRIQHLIK